MSFVTSAFIVTWIALFLLALALAGVVRQVRHLSRPEVGDGRFTATTARQRVRLPEVAVGVPLVLLLVDSACQVCRDRLDDLGQLADRHAGDPVAFGVASRDTLDRHSTVPRVRIHERADTVFEGLTPRMLPFGVVLDPAGEVVVGGAVGSAGRLEQLVATATTHVREVANR